MNSKYLSPKTNIVQPLLDPLELARIQIIALVEKKRILMGKAMSSLNSRVVDVEAKYQ